MLGAFKMNEFIKTKQNKTKKKTKQKRTKTSAKITCYW